MSKGTGPAVILRTAGDKTKGFRFQKIRACIRLLERIAARPEAQIYCAMEFLDDSTIFDSAAPVLAQTEENKNYAAGLSFNSKPIRNTMVAFFDIDGTFMHEGSVGFSVYASAPLADEMVSLEIRQKAGISEEKSKFQILRKLAAGGSLTDEDAAVAKAIVVDEYRQQYPDRGGRIAALEGWSLLEFRRLLQRTDWVFTDDTNEALEEQALDLVRQCPFFDYRHENLEVFILSAILDLLEKRSQSKSLIEKLVGTADIRNLFLECVASRAEKPIDPAHMAWDSLVVDDKRNLAEKILAVSPQYDPKRLTKLERRVGLAKFESKTFDREYVSLRHRVLHACEDALEDQLQNYHGPLQPSQVDDILDALVEKSLERIAALSGSYLYRAFNGETIKGAVLSLFDDCYLAFEGGSQENG